MNTMKVVLKFIGAPLDVSGPNGRRQVTGQVQLASMRGFEGFDNTTLNVREANIKKHKPSKDMMRQLAEDPAGFAVRNLGIYVAAESLVVSTDGVITAIIGGVINGGHSVTCILKAINEGLDLTGGRVNITFYKGYTKEELTEFADALNTSSKPSEMSAMNRRGEFDAIKDAIPQEYRRFIQYKENDGEASDPRVDADGILKLLLSLSPVAFPIGVKTPDKIYGGKAEGRKKNTAKNLDPVLPLAEDIICLETKVIRYFDENNGRNDRAGQKKMALFNVDNTKIPMVTLYNYHSDITVPRPFVLMAMAAFRMFVNDGKWMENGRETNIHELFTRYGALVCRTVYDTYKMSGNNVDPFGKKAMHWVMVENAQLREVEKNSYRAVA